MALYNPGTCITLVGRVFPLLLLGFPSKPLFPLWPPFFFLGGTRCFSPTRSDILNLKVEVESIGSPIYPVANDHPARPGGFPVHSVARSSRKRHRTAIITRYSDPMATRPSTLNTVSRCEQRPAPARKQGRLGNLTSKTQFVI